MRVKRLSSLAIGVILSALAVVGSSKAEDSVVRAMSPWQGSGQIFDVGPNKRQLLGRFTGIMYLDGGKGSLDTALMLCPAVVNIDLKTGKAEASGHCIITDGETNVVYSKWNCSGVPGACDGELTITGGSGRYEGITGGGKMVIRAALVETALDLSNGSVVREAAGLALWPELKYSTPAQ